jgi:hypothetical protein
VLAPIDHLLIISPQLSQRWGLDVYKQSIAIALAETGRGGEVRFPGEIRNEAAAILLDLSQARPHRRPDGVANSQSDQGIGTGKKESSAVD